MQELPLAQAVHGPPLLVLHHGLQQWAQKGVKLSLVHPLFHTEFN
jgi:hypothetical protein